jgi:hypothetical protein
VLQLDAKNWLQRACCEGDCAEEAPGYTLIVMTRIVNLMTVKRSLSEGTARFGGSHCRLCTAAAG